MRIIRVDGGHHDAAEFAVELVIAAAHDDERALRLGVVLADEHEGVVGFFHVLEQFLANHGFVVIEPAVVAFLMGGHRHRAGFINQRERHDLRRFVQPYLEILLGVFGQVVAKQRVEILALDGAAQRQIHAQEGELGVVGENMRQARGLLFALGDGLVVGAAALIGDDDAEHHHDQRRERKQAAHARRAGAGLL
ncbi:MAG: hypothetical protein EBV03_02315 [Proteobacteria bacterium]|nr:hypothetical protein [Pseudomonadota bacterium]